MLKTKINISMFDSSIIHLVNHNAGRDTAVTSPLYRKATKRVSHSHSQYTHSHIHSIKLCPHLTPTTVYLFLYFSHWLCYFPPTLNSHLSLHSPLPHPPPPPSFRISYKLYTVPSQIIIPKKIIFFFITLDV